MLYIRLYAIQIAGVLFLFSAPAFTSNISKDQEIAELFAKCDVNHDGKLTRAEAKDCMLRIYDHFDYLDSSKRGFLTLADIQSAANR